MDSVFLEILLIFILLLANGVFAMAEIAIVAARRGKLQAAADAGSRGAALALRLAESPNRFMSTVQIGITLVGIVAGAFGGASLSKRLAEVLATVPILAGAAEEIAFGIVIALLTYFSLVVGELLPKRLAMLRPEGISAAMSRPMAALSAIAGPLVSFLSWSTDRLLRLFGVPAEAATGVTREEVTVLLREGMITGAIPRAESEMAAGVLELNDLTAEEIMTPRRRLVWLRKDASHQSVWHKIVASTHSYFPIYEENQDQVVGVVSVKSLYAQIAAGAEVRFSDVLIQPLFVPETQSAGKLLESFKQTGVHVALVVDEFGNVIGMVTVLDVLEAIVGDLPSREQRRNVEIRQRADGSWVLDALVEIEKVADQLEGFPVPEGAGDDYQTLAGFLTHELGQVPREGDTVKHGAWSLEVIDTDGHRVDKILAVRAPGENGVPAAV